MKGRRFLLAVVVIVVVLLTASCSLFAGISGSTETRTDTPSGTEEATATPQPTIAEPVTRTDIPLVFMPGLQSIGVVPEENHTIGFIADPSFEEQNTWAELNVLCDQYETRFGITIETILTGDDPQEQIDAAGGMIADGADFLILSPCADDALAGFADLCEQNGVPYITINQSIAATPGQDGYVCTIQPDDYMVGVLTGMSIVDTMTEKYGEPKGNIGEITGVVSDEASILRSMGLRRVLAGYENLNVVCSVAGDADAETSYNAALNILRAYREGELDGIVVFSDATGIESLQAVLDMERDEIVGSIWSAGGTKPGLTGVWYGEFAQTVEQTGQTGMAALEYALTYLNGDGADIPPVVCSITRVFSAETDAKKDALAAIIAAMDTNGTQVCFESMGAYDVFVPDSERLKQYYPKHYYEYDDIDAYLAEFEPYTAQDAIYAVG